MATAGPSRPSPYRRLLTEIGYRAPQHPGSRAAKAAPAAQYTASTRRRSRGPGPRIWYHRRTRVRDNERTVTGRHLLRSRRAGLAITGVVGALCLLVTACSGSSSPGAAKGHTGSQGGRTTTVANEGAA